MKNINQLYPQEAIEDSLELHILRNSSKSQAIYLLTIILFFAAFIALPFIYVTLSIQGIGVIRPVSEKTKLTSPFNEQVTQIFVKENSTVTKNQPILQLKTTAIDSEIEYTMFQIAKTKDFISDLQNLTAKQENFVFRSSVYLKDYQNFKQKINEITSKLRKAKKELERNTGLFNNKLIAEKEYDDLKYRYELIDNEYKMTFFNKINIWESDLDKYQTLLKELESQKDKLLNKKLLFTIRSPISGTIEEFSGIYVGSNLQSGQDIAIISPNSDLIAEAYISPKDIGYVKLHSKVKIQVDAFNYNEWGIIDGNIYEISNDFILSGNDPVFRVRCKMNKIYLLHKNGIKGYLKKGMTTRLRFVIAKRSLFQLLYQNIDDWMNPTQHSK